MSFETALCETCPLLGEYRKQITTEYYDHRSHWYIETTMLLYIREEDYTQSYSKFGL